MPVRTRTITIGPQHHGKRMSLARFAHARAEPGYRYELERGEIVVVDIPGIPHGRVVQFLRRRLMAYDDQAPGRINYIGGGGEAVVRLPNLESERHPDLTVYCSAPPSADEQAWDAWTPDVVVEVVSRSSRKRDYGRKAEDYLSAGVREYWIIDPTNSSATIHTRRGDAWGTRTIQAPGIVKSAALPGFQFSLRDAFAILSDQ